MTDATKELLATETAIPEGAGTPPKANEKLYPVFVSYQAGKKLHSVTVQTPFEEIDRQEHIVSLMNYLTQQHEGKKIDLIFFKSLEG